MKPSIQYWLNDIEEIRKRNNVAWMDLVRLAVEHAPPAELAAIFNDIEINDRKINEKWKCLREQLKAAAQP